MQDILSRNVEYGGAFSSDGASILFDMGNGHTLGAGMLGQQIRWQYGQNISRIYELGSARVYLVAGRTQGQVSLDTILGPVKLVKAWYTQFGDVCHLDQNHITFEGRTGCGAPGAGAVANEMLRIEMKHCVIEQLGGAVQAEQMLIQQQVQIMFLVLKLDDSGGSTSSPRTPTATVSRPWVGASGGMGGPGVAGANP